MTRPLPHGPRGRAWPGPAVAAPGRTAVRPLPLVVLAVAVVAAAISVSTAPAPAPMRPDWRTASVLLAIAIGVWNLLSAHRAFRRAGHLSAVGLLHLWLFLAFAMAAAEQCYRYDHLRLGFWECGLDNAATLGTVALLGGFQVVFFLALGPDVSLSRFVPALRGAVPASAGPGESPPRRVRRPDPARRRAALILVAVALPFLAARLLVFAQLGLRRVVLTMVTRVDYFEVLGDEHVNPALWLFSSLFPVLGVSALCLAVRYALPGVSARGAWCYCAVMVVCLVGCLLSGGRGDLVFVVLTVLFAMRLHGYRTARDFLPIAVPFVLSGTLLILLAQARNGHQNALTTVAGQPYVGDSYSAGDMTQILGLGRFDAMRMIVDRHSSAHGLGAQVYLEAVRGGLNSVFVPRLVLGHDLSYWHVSRDVLGPWIFGVAKGSSLPSAPGELYLAYGVVGVLGGAAVLGLLTRGLLRLAASGPGPAQITWVVLLWTVARSLSDESYLITTFIAHNAPLIILLGLVLRRLPVLGGLSSAPGARRPPAPLGVPRPVPAAGPRVPSVPRPRRTAEQGPPPVQQGSAHVQ